MALNRKLTLEEATAVFDLLVEMCGAHESLRQDFIREHMADPWYWPTEYRFQGNLGFGGKFWNEFDGWRVSTYAEDESKTGEIVAAANVELAMLRKEFRP